MPSFFFGKSLIPDVRRHCSEILFSIFFNICDGMFCSFYRDCRQTASCYTTDEF